MVNLIPEADVYRLRDSTSSRAGWRRPLSCLHIPPFQAGPVGCDMACFLESRRYAQTRDKERVEIRGQHLNLRLNWQTLPNQRNEAGGPDDSGAASLVVPSRRRAGVK